MYCAISCTLWIRFDDDVPMSVVNVEICCGCRACAASARRQVGADLLQRAATACGGRARTRRRSRASRPPSGRRRRGPGARAATRTPLPVDDEAALTARARAARASARPPSRRAPGRRRRGSRPRGANARAGELARGERADVVVREARASTGRRTTSRRASAARCARPSVGVGSGSTCVSAARSSHAALRRPRAGASSSSRDDPRGSGADGLDAGRARSPPSPTRRHASAARAGTRRGFGRSTSTRRDLDLTKTDERGRSGSAGRRGEPTASSGCGGVQGVSSDGSPVAASSPAAPRAGRRRQYGLPADDTASASAPVELDAARARRRERPPSTASRAATA